MLRGEAASATAYTDCTCALLVFQFKTRCQMSHPNIGYSGNRDPFAVTDSNNPNSKPNRLALEVESVTSVILSCNIAHDHDHHLLMRAQRT